MKRRTLVLVLLLATLWGGGASAAADDVAAERAALEAAAAKEFEALAAWCQKKKLYATRNRILERVLEHDPDHAAARKRLKYKRDEDGAWVQDKRYKPPRNLSKANAEEVAARQAKIAGRYRAGLMALCLQAETIPALLAARQVAAGARGRWPGATEITDVERALALRYRDKVHEKGLVAELIAVEDWLRDHHGTDIAVRAVLGEVEHEGVWLLSESVRTLQGAAGLDAVIRTAAAATAKSSKPTKVEAKIELPWSTPAATKHVRVAGTADAKHLAAIAQATDAAGTLFAAALKAKPARRAGLTLYVFRTKGERDTLLAGFPVTKNPTLEHKDKLDLVYADGQTLVVREVPANAQADLAVNEVLNQLMSDTFLGSTVPKAWHAEGISRYLAWKLTGTRLSINVSGRYGGTAKDRHVPETGDKWLAKARAHLGKGKPAGLQLLLGKGTDNFSPRDALVAYAFSIYLIEGFDGLAGAFLKAHAKSKDVDRACRDILGMPRTVAEYRLVRWMDEVIAQQKSNR